MLDTLQKEYGGMNHIMIDVETVAKNDTPIMPQISAMQFCPLTGELGKSFDIRIDMQSAQDAGLGIDVSTVTWWLQQSQDAKNTVFFNDKQQYIEVHEAFRQFLNWLTSVAPFGDKSQLKVWGNGPSFDTAKVRAVYKKLGYTVEPWAFYNERCVRTISALNGNYKKETVFIGTKHDGLADCKHQITYIHSVFQDICEALAASINNKP